MITGVKDSFSYKLISIYMAKKYTNSKLKLSKFKSQANKSRIKNTLSLFLVSAMPHFSFLPLIWVRMVVWKKTVKKPFSLSVRGLGSLYF